MRRLYTAWLIAGCTTLPAFHGQAQEPPEAKEAPAKNVQAAGGTLTAEDALAWNTAQAVFMGSLKEVQAGPVGQSFPPLYTYRLTFDVHELLRGDLEGKKEIVVNHSVRQVDEPRFPPGACVAAVQSTPRGFQALRIEPQPAEDKLKAVKRLCALPLGWRIDGDKVLSPWTSLMAKSKAWPADAQLKADELCSTTGRPALLMGPNAKLEVSPVPPAQEVKFSNPDGDGPYRISVANTTDQPLVVPALLTDGQTILWAESLVILCQNKVYACPGSTGVAGPVRSVELAPGQTVETTVNPLLLTGPDWPRGGYRIAFQFCLGEQSSVQSFYYMSRHHDPIRKKLLEASK